MKTLPPLLAAHYASGATTIAHALRVTRQDGRVFGFTSHDQSERIGGVFYDAAQGLDASAIVSTAGLETDNLDLTTLDDGTLFTHNEVVDGVWQGAAFLIFRYNWAAPSSGTEPVMSGTFGNVVLRRGAIVVELRGLQQYLQQPVGSTSSKTCRARFADYPRPNGNARCGLSVVDWTEAFSVSAAVDKRTFAVVAGGFVGDPYSASNGLLALFNEANGSTTSADSGPSAATIALTGGATITTAQQRFGTASLDVPGAGLATAPHSALLDLATGDFTIQVSVRLISLASSGIIINKGLATGNFTYQVWFNASTTKLGFRAIQSGGGVAVDIAQAGTCTTGVWIDLAVVKSGNTFSLYVDNVLSAFSTYTGSLWASTDALRLGAYSNGVAPFTGQIDHVRITKGVARTISALVAEFPPHVGVTQPDDFYAEGLAVFSSGANAGRTAKVRSWAGGVVTLSSNLPYLPETGDALELIAGCRKRLTEDCAGKFSNARRFQGEPHRPSIDSLTSAPEPSA